MGQDRIALFALDAGCALAAAVSASLGEPIGRHEERVFEDGEHKARPLDSVRNADVFVLSSMHRDDRHTINDKLMRLLFFIATLKDASAGRVTAVVPYLAYARKDQRSKSRDPVATRYVAMMFESVGVDAVVTVDVHNLAAYQNAFRCLTEHLQARPLFIEHFARTLRGRAVAVVSPDAGGIKRAEAFRQSLERALGASVASGFVEKYRSEGRVSGGTFVGDVRDRVAIVVDDLISAGTTIARAAEACRNAGAIAVQAAATHAVFAPAVGATLGPAPVDEIVVTDTISNNSPVDGALATKLVSLPIAPLLAEAIGRLHRHESIVELTSR
jgi:ribose-phosphate pyrophosphokinase